MSDKEATQTTSISMDLEQYRLADAAIDDFNR